MAAQALAAEPTCNLKVVADPASAVYEAGREASFVVTVNFGDTAVSDEHVDAVNLANRCNAGAIMSVGFIDTTCPPSSCYAAYNQRKGPKSIINEPLMGHAAPAHIHDAFFERILKHMGHQTAESVPDRQE